MSPSGTAISPFERFSCDGNGNTTIDFDGLGTLVQNYFLATDNQPEESFQAFYRDPTIKGVWELRISDAFNVDIGTFHSWEI